jgi:hypothetical protein
LLDAGLQQGIARRLDAIVVAQDAEYRADAAADIQIRGAVERVEQHAIAAHALLVLAQNHRLLVLLGSDDRDPLAAAEGREQHLVRDHVEFLLNLTLHIFLADAAEHVLQSRAAHLVGDDLRGDRQRRQDPRKGAGRMRVMTCSARICDCRDKIRIESLSDPAGEAVFSDAVFMPASMPRTREPHMNTTARRGSNELQSTNDYRSSPE